MARYRALALALAASAVLALPARAQVLQRLTVRQLTLAADTTTPHTERRFHLIVTARVSERVSRLENIDLPLLASLELLGDQVTTTRNAQGTTYREVITVVAHHAGTTMIAPVTLDAVDARDGKAKRYFSNSLTLNVQGPGVLATAGPELGALARGIFDVLAWLVGGVALLAVVIALLRRPRRPAPPAPEPLPPAPLPPRARTRADALRDAALTLRADPTRASALHVRNAVRRMVGASDAETLEDVLRAIPDDEPMHGLLRALERAAFTHEADLASAVRAAIDRLEAMSA